MRLRLFSIAFFLLALLAIGALGGALWRVNEAFRGLDGAMDRRHAGFAFAAELARLSQPVASDEVRASLQSIVERFRQSGASQEELKLLDTILRAQQDLQQIAAAAMQGLFDPVQGEFATGGGANAQRKLQAAYGAGYEKQQAKLITDVNRLIALADARTRSAVDAARDAVGRELMLLAAVMIVLLAALVAFGIATNRFVLRPIRRIAASSDRIGQRDYTARVQPGPAVAELRDIAGAFNQMAQAAEEDTRTRMQMTLQLQKARASVAESPQARTAEPPPHKAEEAQRDLVNAETRPPMFDLQDVLAESLSTARGTAKGKPLEMSLELDSELAREPYVVGDAAALQRVLRQLLSNAVRFTDQGSVRLSAFILEAEGDDFVLCFTVTDTGCGLTEDQATRLFGEAETGESSRIVQQSGRSGGLAEAKKLVESMGGDIDVESEPGNGSCFHFTIRVTKAKSPAKVVDISAPRTRPPDGTAGQKRTRSGDV